MRPRLWIDGIEMVSRRSKKRLETVSRPRLQPW